MPYMDDFTVQLQTYMTGSTIQSEGQKVEGTIQDPVRRGAGHCEHGI